MAGMIDVEMQVEIGMRKTPITIVPSRESIQLFRVIAERMDIPLSVQGAIVGCERRVRGFVNGPHGFFAGCERVRKLVEEGVWSCTHSSHSLFTLIWRSWRNCVIELRP